MPTDIDKAYIKHIYTYIYICVCVNVYYLYVLYKLYQYR